MSFVVLTQSDGGFGWSSVGFADTLPQAVRLAKKPGKRFVRGDLFIVVHVDHVSDIVRHIKWTGIALSKSKISEVPRIEGKPGKWILAFDSPTNTAILGLANRALNHHGLMTIGVELLKEIKPIAGESPSVTRGLGVLDMWLRGEATIENIEHAEARLSSVANNSNYAFGYCVSAMLCLFEATRLPKTKAYFKIFGAMNFMDNAYLNHFSRLDYDHNREFVAIIQRMVPLRAVLLAILQHKTLAPITGESAQ